MKKHYEEPQSEEILLKLERPILDISTEGFSKYSNGEDGEGEAWN